MKVIAEFLGTALLVILGNGAVAIVHLKGSKGFASGWIAIAIGYGIGVIAPGDDVPPDFRPDQSGRDDRIGGLGTANHGPSFRHTSPPNCWGRWSASWPSSSPTSRTTTRPRNSRTCSARSPPSTPRGQPGQWLRDRVPRHPRPGARRAGDTARPVVRGRARSEGHRCRVPVWGPVAGLGGPSGPALNPARDLGPRIVHALYPLKHKGSSQWWYSWVPVAAPIAGTLVGVGMFTWLLG